MRVTAYGDHSGERLLAVRQPLGTFVLWIVVGCSRRILQPRTSQLVMSENTPYDTDERRDEERSALVTAATDALRGCFLDRETCIEWNIGDEEPAAGRGRGKFLPTIYESALYSEVPQGIAMHIVSSDMDSNMSFRGGSDGSRSDRARFSFDSDTARTCPLLSAEADWKRATSHDRDWRESAVEGRDFAFSSLALDRWAGKNPAVSKDDWRPLTSRSLSSLRYPRAINIQGGV